MKKEHLASMIQESIEKFGDKTAMRYKEGDQWKSISYQELGSRIRQTAAALLEEGISEGDMVGIFSQNRPEWAIADFAILSIKAVSVPIYATNTARQTEYIVGDADLKIIFVGDQVQYDKVQSFKAAQKQLKKIIALDSNVALQGSDSICLDDFMAMGSKSSRNTEVDARTAAGQSDDIATLIYTSGTTGDPKGAILTHANLFNQFHALDERFTVGTSDRSLCFLPLSHAYERTWSYYIFRCGAENSYVSSPKDIVTFMPEVKPTCMVSVPRLYEKIYGTVYDKLGKASPGKKKIFNWAISTGREYAYKKKDHKMIGPVLKIKHALADKLVLSNIRAVVGGPKNFFSAGGAPLSREIEEFFFAAGLLVCQGYGLTETSPMISCNSPGAFKFGTVGKPILGCEVRIGEFGEIQARGANIMKGYYKKPKETEETFVDGWFKTGDVGIIDEDGFLIITDRIKDLIITAQGKNVAPQHIEMAIGKDFFIEQIVTIGDKRKYISALIVPAFAALEQYARDNNIAFESREDLVKKPEIIAFYGKRIDDLSVELANYEKIVRFTLVPNEFTQDAGELTPTMKIKRKFVAQKYQDMIDKMY
ncbi:MAG: long-chain fatty acid--CoA ligase [Smithellaceae bacterium]